MIGSATAGLLTGLSLIVAIGAQNAFVLRQGIHRSHIGTVVAVCTGSDVVLIAAGVAGLGTLVDHAGPALDVVRWLGVAFLLWYALSSLRRARHAEALGTGGGAGSAAPERAVVLRRAVALTWLNPHVYLDTVLLLGSVAATHGRVGRWWFAVGAALASTIWFSGLGLGARAAAPRLATPRAWQVLEVLVAATMLLVAARLALG